MNYKESLVELHTFARANPKNIRGSEPPPPVFHNIYNSDIEIELGASGNFYGAEIATSQGEKIAIPITADSGNRTSGVSPHPLHENMQYLCRDPRVTHKVFTENNKSITGFDLYVELLSSWVQSAKDPRLDAVLAYVKKETLVNDLCTAGILQVVNGKAKTKGPKPKDPKNLLIRWKVDGDQLWERSDIQDSWINYYRGVVDATAEKGLCSITGDYVPLATHHPKVAVVDGKLFSSNDKTGHTYRGRFTTARECVSIGLEATHKMHNALNWLIRRQNNTIGKKTCYVVWTHALREIAPSIFFETDKEYEGDFGASFAYRLKQSLWGLNVPIDEEELVYILGLRSNSPGRVSVIYQSCTPAGDFLLKIKEWHETYAWKQVYKDLGNKYKKFTGVRSVKDIISDAYGKESSETQEKRAFQNMVSTIIDGQVFPMDTFQELVRRVEKRSYLPYGESQFSDRWGQLLRTTCGIFNGISKKTKGVDYGMTLNKEIKSRSYLFGRLLAAADVIEEHILISDEKDRATAASRYMNAFSQRPVATWRLIWESVCLHKGKCIKDRTLKNMWNEGEDIVSEIMNSFSEESFLKEERLSPEYLLGYYHQRENWLPGYKRTEKQAQKKDKKKKNA